MKITKLIVQNEKNKRTRKVKNRPKWFKLILEFEVKNTLINKWDDNHQFFSHLLDYHEITTIDDPIAYTKEVESSMKKHKNDIIKSLNDNKSFKQQWKKTWTRGLGILFRKGNKYKFGEYFTYTPVTRGILVELEKMKKNPSHSFKVIPEQYLSKLLESLSRFWD